MTPEERIKELQREIGIIVSKRNSVLKDNIAYDMIWADCAKRIDEKQKMIAAIQGALATLEFYCNIN